MLQVNHITLAYGPRIVLDDVSLTVAAGEKAGLIGINGAGKSSLLKIIARQAAPDRGTIMLPRSFGYLSQDVAHETPVASGGAVRDFIFSSTGLDVALQQYEELSLTISSSSNDEVDELLERLPWA